MDQRDQPNDTTTMWSSPTEDQVLLDADCSPTKTCRNMVGITFDGYGEPGTDLQTAWRATLEREGKLSGDGASLRELVLGTHDA
ncbi:MAG TPA: hypothetical protein VLG28_18015 [Acidimicrobiia bacterium]|jgi:hypothetical protein|nr:hypothetical protein [Acidimicrobiia bacterium]